jgi:isopenicillin N synthase-like dioxygenase
VLADPTLKDVLQPLMRNVAETNETTSILTLLGYRPGSRHKGKHKSPLVAAHTDVGVITILLFEHTVHSCAKLQRRDGSQGGSGGSWCDVTLPASVPNDPIFVVNVADCFSELCRGQVASTLHRVVACRSGTAPRSCLALFVGLDAETLLHNMPDDEGTTTTSTITYEQWRKRRIEKSQAILRASSQSSGVMVTAAAKAP